MGRSLKYIALVFYFLALIQIIILLGVGIQSVGVVAGPDGPTAIYIADRVNPYQLRIAGMSLIIAIASTIAFVVKRKKLTTAGREQARQDKLKN